MKATHNPASTAGTDPTPADLLRWAALYLRRRGWSAGALFALDAANPFPPACAAGAIHMAACGSTDMGVYVGKRNAAAAPLIAAAELALVAYIDPDFDPAHQIPTDVIGDYNDEPGRTGEEIAHLLEEVATDWDTTHTAGSESR